MISFLIALLIVALVVLLITAIIVWAISQIPGVPAIAPAIIWVVAALIILLYAIQHLGGLGVRL